MSDPTDPRLHELIHDSVADIEPGDRLHAIKSRTKVSTMNTRRTWIAAVGASVAVAAAAVVAVAVVNRPGPSASPTPGPAASSVTQATEPSGPSPTAPATSSPAVPADLVPTYYLGDTPQGVRLYREFHVVTDPPADDLSAALAALTSTPADPDYRTAWPEGSFASATFADGVISVTLADTSLRDRPASMDEETARMAVQQVVFTVQAAVHQRAPVQFRSPDNPIDQVYGVPTAEPIVNDAPLDVLSLVSLSDPAEGSLVTDTLQVSGVANSFEANVPWQILSGSDEVDHGFFMASGAMEPRLFPFEGSIDVSGLAPGTYTLRVQTDDPSGGEGGGPFEDTRTFVVG
ncbi:MAG: Gmad2 immunoglobulin-like domain-containing protein [Nocardioidaceae bacterium]